MREWRQSVFLRPPIDMTGAAQLQARFSLFTDGDIPAHAAVQSGEMGERMATIEERLARLEAVDEITRLKARYCAYADDNYDAEGLSSLFVADGCWDGGPEFGRHVGRAAIKAFLDRTREQIRFAAHLAINPLIEVQDEAHATGKWRLFMPCTVATDGGTEARWLLCQYDEIYVRENGRWMFQSVDMKVNFYAPHLKGWA